MNESKTIITAKDLVDTFVAYIEMFGSCPIKLSDLHKIGYSFEEVQVKLQDAIATGIPLDKSRI